MIKILKRWLAALLEGVSRFLSTRNEDQQALRLRNIRTVLNAVLAYF